jgi:hypothetical protein
MMNSVPGTEFLSHNVIKIDNYEGRRFKTQHGYEPMMTKSRYMGDQELEPIDPKAPELRRNDNERHLTFGLIRKAEPMKSSVEYQEDIRMKNEILSELSNLRRSQETLIGSKDFSVSGFADVPRCANHNNKKVLLV